MVRFSDMLGGDDDEPRGEPRDESRDGRVAPAPATPGGDAIDRLAQFAVAPSSRTDEPDAPVPADAAPLTTASAELLAALPLIDDTFLPSKAKRH